MKVIIQPGNLKGIIQSPASKSSMQRACAAALVAKGISEVNNPGHSNDDKAAMDIIHRLGAKLEEQSDGTLQISSNGIDPVSTFIDCGESGLSIRMFTPLVALSDREVMIKGSGSLVTRPMDFFDEIMPKLGVKIRSNQGKLPLTVQGPLKPADITVDGSLSSQFLTGLLLAYAASNASGVSIKVNNLKSRPYIDLTLDVMKRFGLKIPENRGYEEFYFAEQPFQADESTRQYTVEGDWSGGAFLLVAGAIAGPVTIRGLDIASTQADKAIVQALMSANAGIAIDAKEIKLHPSKLSGFEFDATDCPDLFPPLVALASYCEGETVIKGVSRLAHKESDRGLTLQEEFGKMGISIQLEGDLMRVKGNTGVRGALVSSRHDHRIAMACVVAALKASGDTTIEHAEAVNKSYPDFYHDLQQAGAAVTLNHQFNFHE